jgi:hypothetical protein
MKLRLRAAEPARHDSDRFRLGARADPEHHRATRFHQRQAQLSGHRRGGERFRDGDVVAIRLLFLRAPVDDADVWELASGFSEEVALAVAGLEQRHFPFGKNRGERNPRRAAAGANVDDRARKVSNERGAGKTALQV